MARSQLYEDDIHLTRTLTSPNISVLCGNAKLRLRLCRQGGAGGVLKCSSALLVSGHRSVVDSGVDRRADTSSYWSDLGAAMSPVKQEKEMAKLKKDMEQV
jgi:hypothetical protein